MQPHTYEKIEAYLTKRLTDSERVVFEKEMAEEAELKETVVKMQLLRKITERNLTRTKITSIHAAKTSEWKKSVATVETIEESPDLPQTVAESVVDMQESGQEINENVNLTAEAVVAEVSDKETDYEEENYEYEEAPPRRNAWLPVLSVLLLVAVVAATAFVYLAKSPVKIRKNQNPVAATTQTDSTQQVYLGIYNDGVQALQANNFLAAISHFDQAINSQKLPNYHTDAARFLEAVAYANQQPNRANRRLNTIMKERKFAYPYTNMDKLQVQCKILWARLMGWNDGKN